MSTVVDAVRRYEQRFGERPNIFMKQPKEVISLIEAALKTGEPIPEPDIPPTAFQ